MSIDDLRYSAGTANWYGFQKVGFSVDDIFRAAEQWARALDGVALPWLCWNVDGDWNLVQQRLVHSVGWTPVVGFDPRVGPPPLIPEAVCIDFNLEFQLPTMWMHFPMEFIFLMCDRMAYWHADCLIRPEKMAALARRFEAMPDGEMSAVKPPEGWRTRLNPRMLRYWEVVGCSTRGASRSQFENGCGWWINFAHHPNGAEHFLERQKYYWDCGTGIRYWHKKLGGKVNLIPNSYVSEGHFTGIGRTDYKRASPQNFRRDLSKELSLNTDLREACRKLGLEAFLTVPER